MSAPSFFATPFRYMRWASHEKPAIFYSICVGSVGPPLALIMPGLREKYFNDPRRERIPMTYPIPTGPRKIPEGYDD